MILPLLAAAAVAASAPQSTTPQSTTDVSGLTVNAPPPNAPPDLVVPAPSEDSLSHAPSVWPDGAWASRTSGEARLSCQIDAFGLAEACEVVAETPAGKGFGKAALQLRPTFRFPATGEPRRLTVAVPFKAPDTGVDSGTAGGAGASAAGGVNFVPQITHVGHNPLTMRSVTMVDHPVWTAAATWDQLRAAWPAKAAEASGLAGGAYAVAHCHVQRSGALGDCQTIKEDPENRGFGAAANQLAQRWFRLSPEQATAPHPTPLWVDVPIRFIAPGAEASAQRTVASPIWLSGVDPARAPKLFPPEAAAAGLVTGRGVARCTVAAGGAMAACAPDSADPDGLGFAEAAAALAVTMKMNPWSADASPVDGAVVRVAVRLNLKP